MPLKSKQRIIALSSCWLASILNIVPGIGTGYIYQRRWRAYWITTLVAFLWTLLTLFSNLNGDSLDPLISNSTDKSTLYGIIIISIISAIEATVTTIRLRSNY